jgi:hypothetical protein
MGTIKSENCNLATIECENPIANVAQQDRPESLAIPARLLPEPLENSGKGAPLIHYFCKLLAHSSSIENVATAATLAAGPRKDAPPGR